MTYNPEPEIQRYLEKLSKAARDLPEGRRRELVAEIEQHIRDALMETPVDNEAEMLTLLDRIGEPDEIVAAASGPAKPTRSTAMETWAIVLLLLGGFLWFVGWIAGVVLLWSSSLWTTRDKLIGTFVVPGGLAAGLAFLLFVGVGESGQTCFRDGEAPTWTCSGGPSTLALIGIVAALAFLVLGPIATAVYLGRRLNKEKRTLAAAT
jgi:hypothetical protein